MKAPQYCPYAGIHTVRPELGELFAGRVYITSVMFRLLLSPILHETEGEIQIFLRLFNYIMFRPLLKDGICGKFIFPVQTRSIFFSKLPEHLLL